MNNAMTQSVQRPRSTKWRKKSFRFKVYMQESGPALILRMAEVFLFFFLCLSECFRLPSPFAACALSAYLLRKKNLLFPTVGIVLSLGLRLVWGIDLDLWQYVGLGMLLLLRLRPPQSLWAASLYTASVLSLRIFAQMIQPSTQEVLILSTVSLLAGTVCTPAVCHAVQMIDMRQGRIHVDDVLCAVILCTVMLSGAGRVAVGPVNIGFVLSGLSILLAACIGGCMAAVGSGLLCGIALSLCGHPDGYVVCYTFSGIVCGLFYGRKRQFLAALYLLCSLFTSYAVRFSVDYDFMLTALLSAGIFLLLPDRAVTGAYARLRALSPDAADNEAAYAQHTRAQWVASIYAIAQQLPEVRLPAPDPEEALEDIAVRLCDGCDRLPQCWHEHREETGALMHAYFAQGDRSARMEDCPRKDGWPALVLENERIQQQRLLRCAYAQREREATRTHLAAIAQAMTRLSQEGGCCDRDDHLLRGEAEYLLRRMHIAGSVLYALRISRHIRVAVRYEPQLTRQMQLERYCESLSQALDAPLHIARRSKDIILFEETPPMMVECFHLSASSGDGNGSNGDSVLMQTADGGLEIAMLSDGMGHGEQAHVESKQTLELLSLCLDAGYTVPDALDAINCIMLSSTDGEQYATVDLCVANLWDGTASLDKLGACPSLLISGTTLRTLESSALPLGILPEIQASSHTFSFGDGDMLLQFTDGLSDACGGMQALERQVELLMHDRLHRSPESVCSALMSAAMRRAGGVPQDDITILCTLFKKRQTKRQKRADAVSA